MPRRHRPHRHRLRPALALLLALLPFASQGLAMPLDRSLTALVHFATSPFPYDGLIPITEQPFLDTIEDGRRGHTSPRGGLLWEDRHYSDTRTLLFAPAGFDPERPATLVVFFHGNNSTLERDVIGRQRVPAQLEASGLNAVLAAPQFAYDAPDSSGGGFWRPHAFQAWLAEVSRQFAAQLGDPDVAARFDTLPIVLVAFSGGYDPAGYALSVGGAGDRICGLFMLDALYDLEEEFADWIEQRRAVFFLSAYTKSSAASQELLQALLTARAVPYASALGDQPTAPGAVTFVTVDDIEHDDLVTRAWRDNPLQWLLEDLARNGRCNG